MAVAGRCLARPVAWLGLLLLVAAVVAAPGTAQAAPAVSTASAEQQLADRYAPVVVLRRYDPPCGSTGEPYVPTTVDAVLGNPEVALRQVGNGDPVIRWGPTASDLYGRGAGVYLDLPGDALQPGCLYATDSARHTRADGSAVYAHVARQADRPGLLALQYWLYWYYNDWNDKHESDWEFVQVLFRAATVEQALAGEPVSVGYAQHEGGEVSGWTSAKLQRDGTHPVVYSSQRSHASYVQPALFLGRGASAGFGCDDTEAPSTRVRPPVVLLPDAPSGPEDRFAWLAFDGRWGERHGAPNDGPTGPMSKPRWSQPVSWQDDLRDSSFVIPGGSAAPPPIVGAFCAVVGTGSVLFVEFVASPAKVLGVLAVLALLLGFLLRRTSWRRVDPLPVIGRRRAGEIVRASAALYRRQPAVLATLGLIAVPVGVLALVVGLVLAHLPFVGQPVNVADAGGPGSRLLVPAGVAAAFWPLTLFLVSAAVSVALDHAGAARGAAAAVRQVWRRAGALASSFLPAAVLIGLLSLSAIGLPVAAWLAVRYQFAAQVVMLEPTGGWRALRRSGALVRHRWWHTAVIAVLVWAGVQVVAVLLGLLLLVTVTGLPLWAVTGVAVAAQVLLVPLGATVLTLLYGDARAQHDEAVPEPSPQPELAGT